MISLDAIAGAWKIEESPEGHIYGTPNTHWLIVGDRVMVIQDRIARPSIFDMQIRIRPRGTENSIGLSGSNGGSGFAEVDSDMLFISIGKNGRSLPRFAPDCGWFFAFTRDRDFQLPVVELSPRTPVTHPVLGHLEWNHQLETWVASVAIIGESECEVLLDDTLVPLHIQIQKLLEFVDWLRPNLSNAILACAERVREWVVPEDQEFDDWPLEQFIKTISIDTIDVGMHDFSLWASTSIPIDHSLHVWIKIVNDRFEINGVSVEG
jgi:hypothetical protein